ncbi:hypothetical protein BCAL_0346 [Bifidobacterium callitrichos DSM 23973]|uniref:Uncharacterized protein n=1 Tax=Bifidobacterium callitrichos DSM 23973 TaxID=1437609 RepID=A0A087AD89_9BIFI|nr:hypothetical protein BCAL_0346 [Bifidobacterium callitrichos DSM 23973]
MLVGLGCLVFAGVRVPRHDAGEELFGHEPADLGGGDEIGIVERRTEDAENARKIKMFEQLQPTAFLRVFDVLDVRGVREQDRLDVRPYAVFGSFHELRISMRAEQHPAIAEQRHGYIRQFGRDGKLAVAHRCGEHRIALRDQVVLDLVAHVPHRREVQVERGPVIASHIGDLLDADLFDGLLLIELPERLLDVANGLPGLFRILLGHGPAP